MPLFPVHQQRMLEKLERQSQRMKSAPDTDTKGPVMASKRELIEPHSADKRFVRRYETGEFKKEVDVGKSLAADRRTKAKTVAKSGQGDKGDRKAKR
jgi:hypothetical protein